MTEPLTIPDITENDGTLTAALKYAASGFYVGPVSYRTKDPALTLRAGWPRKTSTDPEVIVPWFAGTNHGVFIHAGRSGVLIFDVDKPDKLHPDVRRAIDELQPPYQTTRRGETERGHYFFAMPLGRVLGNSIGRLGKGWGEIRGHNGLAVVSPSVHEEDDGLYVWRRTGPVPTLPDYLADQLEDRMATDDDMASDAEIKVFLQEHTLAEDPRLLDIHVNGYNKVVKGGESRHDSMCGRLAGAMREAKAGLIDAGQAEQRMREAFMTAVASAPVSHKQGKSRTGQPAVREWRGILSWAVAQARGSDPAATRVRIAEKVPKVTDWLPGPTPPEPVPDNVDPTTGEVLTMTLDEADAAFRRWLGDDYDLDAMHATLAAAAVEKMDGDPIWLLLISGSGNAKTETVQALSGAGALAVSTITSEGALLSASSKKDRAQDATGGLLREIGDRGLLVVKDVTSILSMNRDQRAAVLGALREVYDGSWTRSVGTDGAKRLTWDGRVAVVGAVTTAWDSAHSVISAMGDRFVLLRMDSTCGRQAAGRRAIRNTGSEALMRAELAAAVAGVLASVDPSRAIEPTEDETDRLLAAADLVTLARTAVEFDYRGEVIDAHAPEMPTRFAKQLTQILRGAVAVGMDRTEALQLAIRCARDSMPPLRLAIIDDLSEHTYSHTADIRRRLAKPRTTVDRQLQALHMLEVLDVDEEEGEWNGRASTRWHYSLAEGITPDALDPKSVPEMSVHTPRPLEERVWEERDREGTDKSGQGLTSDFTADPWAETRPCGVCGTPLSPDRHAYGSTTCVRCATLAKEAS